MCRLQWRGVLWGWKLLDDGQEKLVGADSGGLNHRNMVCEIGEDCWNKTRRERNHDPMREAEKFSQPPQRC